MGADSSHAPAESGGMDVKPLTKAAAHALRRGLQRSPRHALVLWQAAAYSVAFQELPSEYAHRLGHVQRAAPLQITAAPPASANAWVHSIFSMAVSSGTACLNLRAAAKVTSRSLNLLEQHLCCSSCIHI